jgi:MFS transporter, DHA2 family, multidrug resistance protein
MICVIAAIFLLARHFPHVPTPTDPRLRSVDKIGIGLLAIALIALQVVCSRGEIDDWFGSMQIQVLTWVSGIALLLFVVWQRSAQNPSPLLRLDLIANRNTFASIPLGIMAGIILSGSIYALPEFLRNVDPNKLSATTTGQIMCAYALAAAAIRPLVTRAIGKFGQRKVLVFAFSMLIISMLMLAQLLTTGTPEALYAVPLILYAFCLAPLLSSVGGGTVGRMPQEQQLDAVSIYMSFRQFGTSLGVTLIAMILDRREQLHSSRLFEHLQASGTKVQDWLDTVGHVMLQRAGATSVDAQHMALKLLSEASATQAATLAYADAFIFMAAMGAVALCLVPIMSPTGK